MEVYCVYCRDVVPKAQAATVMRSGFYRTVIPAGTCRSCEACRDMPAVVRFPEAALDVVCVPM